MRWLIYTVVPAPVLPTWQAIGTVEAPSRYEAQRRAIASEWLSRYPDAPTPAASSRLAAYWPIQLPDEQVRH